MPARSSPIKIGDKSYHLRFERIDIKAIENALGISYQYFVKPGIWGSLNAVEAFVWRGLREETRTGELVHALDQTDAGKDAAGSMVWDYMQAGGDMGALNDQILEGFFACQLFRRKDPAEPDRKGDEKNPESPTGTTPPTA